MTDVAGLVERIRAYLSLGGLWNPDLANHDAVRDLIIDSRDALLSLSAQLAEKEEHLSQTLDQLQRHMNWDSAEWDRQLLALKRQLTEKEAECEMKLPCGVKLDSGTHIGKGCALSTLIVALKARAKYKADAARQP